MNTNAILRIIYMLSLSIMVGSLAACGKKGRPQVPADCKTEASAIDADDFFCPPKEYPAVYPPCDE